MNLSLPVRKAQVSRYAPVTPHVNPYADSKTGKPGYVALE